MNESIIQKALDLGAAIGQSAEMNQLKELQARLHADIEASSLIMKYQEARMAIENKMGDGITITKAEEDHLDILEQQLNNNPLLIEMMAVQEKFDNLMQGVYYAMNQAISGSDSCDCSCDSCGGGCGC